ncbi:MAG: hypothetical protein COA96_16725 [SAR86 cluster bacterium]|uniref:Uncharacterized protein n=1 Tax=SAR86 cluster bacterium TaxID=2030880 RepID=A0A2A5AG45_9GAMM|nr:MAG: hypothetical protein COA96_16725 [SAR86 cluster bacterium]
MAKPIVTQITDEIATTLAGITIANGYQQDATIERVKVDGNDPKNNMLVVHPLGKARTNNDTISDDPPIMEFGQRIEWMQNYVIEGTIQEAKDSGVTIDERVDTLVADIEKILMVDIGRGGLAERTILETTDNFLVDRPVALAVFFSVHYFTQRNDPYTQ